MIKNGTQISWQGSAAAGEEIKDVDRKGKIEGPSSGKLSQAHKQAGGEEQQRATQTSGM